MYPLRHAPALLAGTVVLLVLAGCGGDAAEAGAAAADATDAIDRWSLSAEPELQIGVLAGDEAYQLHDVRDAVRLPDGRIAIAHQGTREVRVYGPDGTLLVSQGEDGDGPGQWRMLAELHALPADTLVVVDRRLRRTGLVHAGTGEYLGEMDEARAATFTRNGWLHDGLILEVPHDVDDPGLLAPVVERLDIRDGSAPTFVRLEGDGRVWVVGAPSAASPTLRLFDLEGRERAVLPLPDRFTPLDVGEERVVGVWRDSLDVQYLRAHAIEGRSAWSGPTVAEARAGNRTLPPSTSVRGSELPELNAAFKMMAGAQEMSYAANMSYTTDLATLNATRDLGIPDGARVDILEASPTGWRARVVDERTGAGCALAYGFFPQVEGMEPGRISCWSAERDGAEPEATGS